MEPAAPAPIALDKQYEMLQVSIRETDQISFKLLGLVPLVNGLALLGVILGDKTVVRPSPPAIVALSLFGALVTLGLFWWELRNIQNCLRYIYFAEEIMKLTPAVLGMPKYIWDQPKPPGGLGKRRGEKLLYLTVILTWLVLPITLLQRCELPNAGWMGYVVVAILCFAGTIWAVFSEVDVKKMKP